MGYVMDEVSIVVRPDLSVSAKKYKAERAFGTAAVMQPDSGEIGPVGASSHGRVHTHLHM